MQKDQGYCNATNAYSIYLICMVFRGWVGLLNFREVHMKVNYFRLICFPPGSQCDLQSFSQTINKGQTMLKRTLILYASKHFLSVELEQQTCISLHCISSVALCLFRCASISSTYPCLSVRWLVTLLNFHTIRVSGCST